MTLVWWISVCKPNLVQIGPKIADTHLFSKMTAPSWICFAPNFGQFYRKGRADILRTTYYMHGNWAELADEINFAVLHCVTRLQCFFSNLGLIVLCHRTLQSLTYCYARVIQETCNTSAADINMLKTFVYSKKLSSSARASCPFSKSHSLWYCCGMQDNCIGMPRS